MQLSVNHQGSETDDAGLTNNPDPIRGQSKL